MNKLTDQTEEHNGEQDRDDDVQYGEPEPRIFKQLINKLIVNQLLHYLNNRALQKETPVFTCCWHWGSPAFSVTSDIHRSWPTLKCILIAKCRRFSHCFQQWQQYQNVFLGSWQWICSPCRWSHALPRCKMCLGSVPRPLPWFKISKQLFCFQEFEHQSLPWHKIWE